MVHVSPVDMSVADRILVAFSLEKVINTKSEVCQDFSESEAAFLGRWKTFFLARRELSFKIADYPPVKDLSS